MLHKFGSRQSGPPVLVDRRLEHAEAKHLDERRSARNNVGIGVSAWDSLSLSRERSFSSTIAMKLLQDHRDELRILTTSTGSLAESLDFRELSIKLEEQVGTADRIPFFFIWNQKMISKTIAVASTKRSSGSNGLAEKAR